MSQVYEAAVGLMRAIHLAWILWVIFGAIWTRGRPWLTVLHIGSLIWGIAVETGPWPCPLTLAEDHFQQLAGGIPYKGSFLVHFLSVIVYPNVPVLLLTVCGVAVCVVNLFVYVWRWWLAARWAKGK